MSSRQYIKRVWRVPKDRGAPAFLAALVTKALVKHGWPAKAEVLPEYLSGFVILHFQLGENAPADFWDAVEVAVRIVARTYKVDYIQDRGLVLLQGSYHVSDKGVFKRLK